MQKTCALHGGTRTSDRWRKVPWKPFGRGPSRGTLPKWIHFLGESCMFCRSRIHQKRMDKEDFDKELRVRFPGNYHPFRSNGHPLEADIIFIGYNFSSSIDKPFLDYWDKEQGYKYKEFQDQREADTNKLNAELKLRKAEIAAHNAKLPGRWHPTWIKTRHSSISSTRRNYIALTLLRSYHCHLRQRGLPCLRRVARPLPESAPKYSQPTFNQHANSEEG